MLLPAQYDERKWTLASQIGINYSITKATTSLSGLPPPYDFEALNKLHKQFAAKGFRLYGLEGDQFDMSPIKLGLSGRDECIERFILMIRNMGKLEMPLLCYNFMASVGWYRTNVNIKERGGALVSEFIMKGVEGQLVDDELRISEERLWENLFYFLNAVLPEAEAVGVRMALHPDDPPVSPLLGIGRILTQAKAFEKIWDRYPQQSNAITFCQATFKLMGEDIKDLSAKWLKEGRVPFLHIRDVLGEKDHFRETFHDNGPTPMEEMLEHYHAHGFDGLLRPDHAPAMFGESQNEFSSGTSVGYGITGKIFGLGYLKGICHAKGISVE